MGTKLLLLIAGSVVLSLLVIPSDLPFAMKLTMIVGGSAMLFFIPNLGVGIRRDKRRAEVKKVLPDAVDMLEICVSSGMGIDAAWTAVGDEIRRVSPTFADEMELTNLEVSLGVPRAVAMRHMADRTGAEDLSSLVALLVQSERFGAGIIEALTTFAKTMRETRGQRAEEAAEKMAVKLLFPMVMFIFPALILIMVGPAIIQLSNYIF
jgi:tight adherence protein C